MTAPLDTKAPDSNWVLQDYGKGKRRAIAGTSCFFRQAAPTRHDACPSL